MIEINNISTISIRKNFSYTVLAYTNSNGISIIFNTAKNNYSDMELQIRETKIKNSIHMFYMPGPTLDCEFSKTNLNFDKKFEYLNKYD